MTKNLNTLPFDFIQCSSAYIKKIKEEEKRKKEKIENGEPYDKETDASLEGIQEGALYFVLDTKQILLGKQSKLMPMGGGAGVRFAKQDFGANLNPEVVFFLSSLEDQNTLPQVDDLIFNTGDDCFYRVTELNDLSFKAERLTVSGSGGGSSSGSNKDNVVSSQKAEYNIPRDKFKFDDVPAYIVANEEGTFTVKNQVDFYLDDIETHGEDIIEQTIIINNVEVEGGTTSITPWQENTIIFQKSWFKSSSSKVQLRYTYGSTPPYTMDLSMPKITVFDLEIYDDKGFGETVKSVINDVDNMLIFTGSVDKVLDETKYEQKINCKIKHYSSALDNQIELEGENIYSPDYIHGTSGNRYFLLGDREFTVPFSNIPYGIYTLEAYQSVGIIKNNKVSETLVGKTVKYYFIIGDNKNAGKEILFLCDLSKIDGKVFKDSDSLEIPLMIHVPGLGEKTQAVPIKISYDLSSTGPEEDPVSSHNIQSDKLIVLSLSDIPVDDGKEYTLTVYLQEYPHLFEQARITVKKSITVGSGAVSMFKLSAAGHENTENSRDIWLNSSRGSLSAAGAKARLTNFTWTTQGTGWTSTALRVGGNALATVENFNPFDTSVAKNPLLEVGRTFMFHFNTLNFTRRQSADPIINCTANDGSLGVKIYGDRIEVLNPNLLGQIKIPYTYQEDIHLTVCMSGINKEDTAGTVNNTSGSRRGLVEVYINGILTSARLYTEANFPSSLSDIDFTIGHQDAKIDLYSIDIFRGVLKPKEVVKYYLSTLQDSSLATQIRNHNDIYEEGKDNIDINKLLKNGKIPVMIIKGALPESKTDAGKVVAIEFEHPTEKEKSFSVGHPFLDKKEENDKDPTGETYRKKLAEMVTIEVQGTSSQFYPVKNWKLKNLKVDGKKYQLDTDMVRTGTYCLKADYAESTGTHNTQNANFIETLYNTSAMGSCEKTTAQRDNPNCRTTIYGYPIVVFHQETSKSEPEFLGKYNFNFDKGSKEVFGFERTIEHEDGTEEKIPLGECWEFCDNDDIAGMIYGAFDKVKKSKYSRYAWDKWKVIYYSTDYSGTKEVYFPLDVDLYPDHIKNNPTFITLFTPPEDRGFSYKPAGVSELNKKCNSNYDYVKSLIKPYMQLMKTLETDSQEKAWWSTSNYYEDQITPLWMEYFEPRYCGNYLYDAYGKVIKYADGTELDENGNIVTAMEKVADISNFAELYSWIMDTGEPLKPIKEEEFINRDITFAEGTLVFKTQGGEHVIQPGMSLVYEEYEHLADEYKQYFTLIKNENYEDRYLFTEDTEMIIPYPQMLELSINEVMHPTDAEKRSKQDVFTEDLSKYFDEKGLVFYYLYTHFAIMADQRAKNMFFTLWYPVDEKNQLLPTTEKDPETGVERKLSRLELLEKCSHGGRWCPWFYDNDTSFGIDNQGIESFDYSADDDASDSSKKVYQGTGSVLWRNLKRCKLGMIQDLYDQLRNVDKVLNYNTLCKYFITNSANKWPISIYNEDQKRKYINYAYQTILLSNNETDKDDSSKREEVINNIRGDGVTHFKQFIKDRITYCDTKWGSTLNPNTTFIFRPMNPSPFNVDYSFTPYSTGTYGLYFGAPDGEVPLYTISNSFTKKGTANELYTEFNMRVPTSDFNVTYLAPPESFLDLGDMSNFNVALFANGGKLTRLETLTMGNKEKTPKYVKEIDGKYYSITGNKFNQIKTLLENYTPNNNELIPENVNALRENRLFCPKTFTVESQSLKQLDFSNIDVFYLQGGHGDPITNLDLSKCSNIRRVYCRNSTIPRINFLDGGYLEELIVTDYYKNFTIKHQLLLKEENVIFENCLVDNERNPYRNLNTIVIENCDAFNSKEFLLKSLHQNNEIENYNIPDEYLTSGKSVRKMIKITGIDYKKDAEGNPVTFKNEKGEDVYSHWVFKDNSEFETFISNLETYVNPDENGNQPVILTTSEDGKIKNKIYLEGSCYVLGKVDGGLKKRLRKLVEGNFNIYTSKDSTDYTVRFYYIDLESKERKAILKDGEPYTQIVKEGFPIYDPYINKYDEYGNETGSTGAFSNDNRDNINYVPDFDDINGYAWTHHKNPGQHHWMIKEKDVIPTLEEVQNSQNDLSLTTVYEDIDVYAVYVKEANFYFVTVNNRGTTVPGFENPVRVKYDDWLYNWTDARLPEKVDYPAPTPEESKAHDFAGWYPDPTKEKIKGTTTINATYNYVDYQTTTLLNKKIEEVSILVDKIPDYRFCNCDKLQGVYIPQVDKVVELLGENVFKDSAIFTDKQKSNGEPAGRKLTPGNIYVLTKEIQDEYLKDSRWKEYKTSILVGKKGDN